MERFASVKEGDINKILSEKNSVNTHKATSVSWNVFTQYELENKLSINEILRTFYVEVRKQMVIIIHKRR